MVWGQRAGKENEKIFYLGLIPTKNQLTYMNILIFTYWKHFQRWQVSKDPEENTNDKLVQVNGKRSIL